MKKQRHSQVLYTELPAWLAVVGVVLPLIILGILVFSPAQSLLERLRWLVSGICAQATTHVFYPGGEQLPLCARNTGIFLGYALTLAGFFLSGRKGTQRIPSRPIGIALASGLVLCALDGTNSFFVDLGLPHLYQPQNELRLITGLLAGQALAAFLFPMQNRLLWRIPNDQQSIPSWSTLLLHIPVLLLCLLAILSHSIWILYPVALLSTSGILIALSSVNLIVIVALSKQEETFECIRALLPFIAVALACAISEMMLLAQLKQMLVQTLGITL